jgi:hypothetical protein
MVVVMHSWCIVVHCVAIVFGHLLLLGDFNLC